MDDNYQEYDSWKFNEWTLNEIAKDPLKDCFKSSQKVKYFLLFQKLQTPINF